MNRRIAIVAVASLLVSSLAFAQHDAPATDTAGKPKPRLSPAATASATVAGKKLSIDYSQPSARGRKIMGGLVPFGKVWRTGANEATTLKTEATLKIGDLVVPAGTYTLWTIPEAGSWTLIVNKQTGQWGTEYHEDQDLGRTKIKASAVKSPVETFVIDIKPTKGNWGVITFTWENTQASAPFAVQ